MDRMVQTRGVRFGNLRVLVLLSADDWVLLAPLGHDLQRALVHS